MWERSVPSILFPFALLLYLPRKIYSIDSWSVEWARTPEENIITVGLVTSAMILCFQNQMSPHFFSVIPNSSIHSNSNSTFLSCSVGFNCLPDDDLTYHSQKKKITKFSGENFICSLGTQWILKPHLLIFSFSLFRKWCVCALTQKQSFHLCSRSSWPPYLASSFIPFLLRNFYIFISTDTFLFLIWYSNFSCLKKK